MTSFFVTRNYAAWFFFRPGVFFLRKVWYSKNMKTELENPSEFEARGADWHIWEALLVLLAATFLASLPGLFAASAGSLIGLNLVAYLLQEGSFFVLPLALTAAHGLPVSVLGFGKLRWRSIRIGLLAGVALYLLNILLSSISAALLPEDLQQPQSILLLFSLAENRIELILLAVFTALLAPLGEEVAFRAFLLPPLLQRYRKWVAYIICGAIFAAMHLNLAVFLPLFAGGVGFAWLYGKFGDIYSNIVAHMVWNGIALFLLFLLNS